MPECIGVRFENGPKLHYVEAPPQPPRLGTRCVVSTRRGLEIGLVRTEVRDHGSPNGYYVREVQPEDLERQRGLHERSEELKWLLRARAREVDGAIKIVSLDFNLDETLLIVNYSSEGQAPLRVLAAELSKFTEARIEFNNVGPRDQARILGALGACGQGSCSSTWLQSFSAVSIRMARDQQLPLNPEKISGPCGRLMCCLQFEHEMYGEILKGMPKRGSRACHTETGSCGRVLKLHPLKGTVEFEDEEGKVTELPASEVKRLNRPSKGAGKGGRGPAGDDEGADAD